MSISRDIAQEQNKYKNQNNVSFFNVTCYILPANGRAVSHFVRVPELSPTLSGFQGSTPLSPSWCCQDLGSLLRLWYHENLRIFSDRLINDEDRTWFEELLKEKLKTNFEMEYSEVVPQEPIIYGDFMTQNIDVRPYREIVDHGKVPWDLCISSHT